MPSLFFVDGDTAISLTSIMVPSRIIEPFLGIVASGADSGAISILKKAPMTCLS